MPSWNIHTAHVEHLLDRFGAQQLGIQDANCFLFGNYVPDIYLGFMVQGATYRIDYCLTHVATPNMIPLPDADRFWDTCVARRKPSTAAGLSLALGAWAHLAADRIYNERFRMFCQTHDVPKGDELRKAKQGDFDIFGRSLGIASHVQVTPELIEAAFSFRQYSILADDVVRAVSVADDTVNAASARPANAAYKLLDAQWLADTFEACNDFVSAWLQAGLQLASDDQPCTSNDIRAAIGSRLGALYKGDA